MTGTRDWRRRTGWLLWFGLLGGAAAWSVHLVGMQFAVELLCEQGVVEDSAAGGTLFVVLLLGTALAALAAVAAAWGGFRERRQLRSAEPRLSGLAALATVGAWLSAFFAMLIVLEALPLFVFGCGSA